MGGVETALLSLLKFLKNYDVEVDLYVIEEGMLKEKIKKITNVNIIPADIPKNRFIYRIKKSLLCNSIYKKYKYNQEKEYDIAIAFYGINNYSDLYAAASNAKEKFIWVHNDFYTQYKISKYKPIIKLRNMMMQKKFKYFDKIVSVSNSAKEGFLKMFKCDSKKVIVINNFFDVERLKAKDEKCQIKMTGNNNVLYVGRLVEIKKVDLLIQEFKKVKDKISDAHLYIVGDGPKKDKLIQLTKQLGLESDVTFLGYQENPFSFLKQVDVLATASQTESYAINLFEALAMHKYFVSTDNEGAKEMFHLTNNGNKNNGVVCDTNDIHKHIIYYLNNKDKIKPNFDVNKCNAKIEQNLLKCFGLKK